MKPLTRYALESYVQGWHERHEMTADPGGKWYAKDEADAIITEYQAIAIQAASQLQAERIRTRELEAERDAARADAERNRVNADRYEWLRDSAAGQWEHPIVVSQKRQGDRMLYVGPLGFKALDAAIDAARGAA